MLLTLLLLMLAGCAYLQCPGGWGPPGDCSLPECGGLLAGTDLVCSGRGNCLSSHVCVCTVDTGLWGGDFCNVSKCGGIVATAPAVCNDQRGVCESWHTCTCIHDTDRFGGDFCDTPICGGVLKGVTGECNFQGTCTYNVALNKTRCACNPHYDGDLCEFPVCYGKSSKPGGMACSGHGTCRAETFDCICESVFYRGDRCHINTCKGFASTSSLACSGHGYCMDFEVCDCDYLYDGPYCKYPTCFGTIANDTEAVCSGHGKCSNPNTCECEDGYVLKDCSEVEAVITTSEFYMGLTNGIIGGIVLLVFVFVVVIAVLLCALQCKDKPVAASGDVEAPMVAALGRSGVSAASAAASPAPVGATSAAVKYQKAELEKKEKAVAAQERRLQTSLRAAEEKERSLSQLQEKIRGDQAEIEEKKANMVDLIQQQLVQEERERMQALEDTISGFRELEDVISESREHASKLKVMVKRRDVIIAKYEQFARNLKMNGLCGSDELEGLNREIRRGIIEAEVSMGLRDASELEGLGEEEI